MGSFVVAREEWGRCCIIKLGLQCRISGFEIHYQYQVMECQLYIAVADVGKSNLNRRKNFCRRPPLFCNRAMLVLFFFSRNVLYFFIVAASKTPFSRFASALS